MASPDLLIPLWSTFGRDFEALLPVAWYCEAKLGLRVTFRSMFDVHQIYRLRPRVILISSSTGSRRCLDLVRAAHACNIPTISLTAEGDFKEETFEQMFWGLNSDRILYEDLNLQWSERTRRMTLARYPEYADRIRVSGAAGFDRYKIYRFVSRKEFLAHHTSTAYKLVVGYAGYGFDRLEMPQFRHQYLDVHDQAGLERLLRDRDAVRDVLRATIQAHPEVLFVLKYHPGTLNRAGTELYGLDELPNTVVLWREEIADIISACDLWTAYDSTTVLEAWLLGKPTLLVNPSGTNFVRSRLYRGAGIVRTADELATAIAQLQAGDRVQCSEEQAQQRHELVRDTIQWDDGLNHVRIAQIVYEMWGNPRRYQAPPVSSYVYWWGIHQLIRLAHVAPHLVPLRRLRQVPQLFSPSQLAAVQQRYYPQLARFHQRQAMPAAERMANA